jgi:hypothetical protein
LKDVCNFARIRIQVVVVAFQIIFYTEIYINGFFLKKKIIFNISIYEPKYINYIKF